MPDDLVITEKTSQAKDVRAAVGARFGPVLPAEGHLLALLEPEEVAPAWKRWAPVLLRPDGLYGTKPATGGNKAPKLKAIRDALKAAQRVWLATDCDREGQLIGQEILEHCRYRGTAWIQRPTSPLFSTGSQVATRSAASTSCCPGTGRCPRSIGGSPSPWPPTTSSACRSR